MEYFLIFCFQFFGISLNILFKLLELDKLSEEDSLSDIWNIFWRTDKITVLISLVVLLLNEFVHFVIEFYTEFPLTIPYYQIWAFAFALIVGYGGQQLIYNWLGKSRDFLNKKVGDRLS